MQNEMIFFCMFLVCRSQFDHKAHKKQFAILINQDKDAPSSVHGLRRFKCEFFFFFFLGLSYSSMISIRNK